MPQSKILVDTNAYLRLANTIRPLLFAPFGENEYCLYILPELNEELKNNKLQNTFYWVTENEYVENRKHFPAIGRKQKKAINQAFEYVWDYVQTDLPGPSKVDALYVAYAIELDIPVVTDDQDMTALAKAFDAKVMPTLELLKIMLDCGHMDMKTIKGLYEYWRQFGDRPANMEADFKRLFSDQ
ncbi:MAG: DNA-binding protein [Methylococcales bacterium]|nr:DNA-binding protein [Methylococcaceae bacterium]